MSAGDVVVTEGSSQPAIYFIRAGQRTWNARSLRQGVVVATLGIGDVFGEMSFLGATDASATVIADDDLILDVVEADRLKALADSDPNFGSRLYRSLAVTLAAHLRDTLDRLPTLLVEDVPQVNRFHTKPRVVPSLRRCSLRSSIPWPS